MPLGGAALPRCDRLDRVNERYLITEVIAPGGEQHRILHVAGHL
jgi:hypothetical protein